MERRSLRRPLVGAWRAVFKQANRRIHPGIEDMAATALWPSATLCPAWMEGAVSRAASCRRHRLPRFPCCRRAGAKISIQASSSSVLTAWTRDLERHWTLFRSRPGLGGSKLRLLRKVLVAWSKLLITDWNQPTTGSSTSFIESPNNALAIFVDELNSPVLSVECRRVIFSPAAQSFLILEVVVDRGVPVTTMRVPTNYPPAKWACPIFGALSAFSHSLH